MESLSLISRMGRRVVPVLVLALAVGWVAFAVLTWLAEGVFRDCAACPLIVEVPAGSFMMGSPVGGASGQRRGATAPGDDRVCVCGGRVRGDVRGCGTRACAEAVATGMSRTTRDRVGGDAP